MDVRFCEGRSHRREAHMRAEGFCMLSVRALPSAPQETWFPLDRRFTWMSDSVKSAFTERPKSGSDLDELATGSEHTAQVVPEVARPRNVPPGTNAPLHFGD